MCRGKNECSELGADSSRWDKRCLLRHPVWMSAEVDRLSRAVRALVDGRRDLAITELRESRDEEMRTWFIEHGQMSGRHRNMGLKREKPVPVDEESRDVLRNPRKYQRQVFERDGYRCRYCGFRLVDQDVLKLFIKKLGWDGFRKGPTNLTTHGLIHLVWPVADHVVPWNLGGRTDLGNLVTSCGPCNYGKDGYTLDQLGLDDPLNYPIESGDWNGLGAYMKALK